MWNDEDFRELSGPPPNAQTLWIRLLTGPELTNIPGLFSAWEAGIAQSLNWSIEDFRRVCEEISMKSMAKFSWRQGLVWIPKSIKHNPPANVNIIKSWSRTWVELPECALKTEAHEHLLKYLISLGEDYAKAFVKACPIKGYQPSIPFLSEPATDDSNPNRMANGIGNGMANQDQDQEQEQDQDHEADVLTTSESKTTPDEKAQVKRIFEFWKKVMKHPQSKLDNKRKVRILARLREGFEPEQIRDAILGALKDDFLMGRDKHAGRKYDGIETVLRDAAQVERLIELCGQKKNLAGQVVTETKQEAEEKAKKHEIAMEKKRERDRIATEKFLSSVPKPELSTNNVKDLLQNVNI